MGASVGGRTLVDLTFFGAPYESAEVCVNDTCGVVGVDAQFLVSPPVVGSSFRLSVTLREVQLDREVAFAETLTALGEEPDGAYTSRLSLALVTSASGCDVYVTNHEVNGTLVASTPPDPARVEALCGPFAPSEG